MKNTGVWLDKNKAFVVTLENEEEYTTCIFSNIEHFRIHGGSGTRLKGGPQDVVQDSKYLEREKHQVKRYFTEIIELIKNADAIAIFGPAGTNEHLKKEIELHHHNLDQKVVHIEKTDSMTDNQMKALVRDFFFPNR